MTERTAIHPLAVVYTVDQFCAVHMISRDTFERLVRRGELAAFKIGRRTYIAKEEAARWLREKLSHGLPPSPSHGLSPNLSHGSERNRAARSGKRGRQDIEKTKDNSQISGIERQ